MHRDGTARIVIRVSIVLMSTSVNIGNSEISRVAYDKLVYPMARTLFVCIKHGYKVCGRFPNQWQMIDVIMFPNTDFPELSKHCFDFRGGHSLMLSLCILYLSTYL